MSINVRGATGKPASATTNKTKTAQTGKSAQTPGSSVASQDDDSVQLTEEVSRIQQIEQSLASIPIVNAGRVKAVSDALEDGSYTVDAERVADKIIEMETEMARGKKKS